MKELEYEQHLDVVDKLSLKGKYTKAFQYINEVGDSLFEPVKTQNLKDLVKLNALKHGHTLA